MIDTRTAIINPQPIKQDHRLASAIERWEERCRAWIEDDTENELAEKWKMAAIRDMFTGDVKKHVTEMLENCE